MRFCELCDREVVNANDCKCLGQVKDIEFDPECGKLNSIIIPGPGKYMGLFGKEFEYRIPWCKIIRIGPDIILVDLQDDTMRCKL